MNSIYHCTKEPMNGIDVYCNTKGGAITFESYGDDKKKYYYTVNGNKAVYTGREDLEGKLK